jgi:hypothetical protein
MASIFYATSGNAYSFIGDHALKFGAVSEAILLSLALADKISLMSDDKEKAKQELL